MPSKIERREGKKGVTWRVRFPEVDEDGNKKFHTATFPYLREAEDYVRQLEDARDEGKPVTESEQPLKSFFGDYLEATDLREQTRKSYKEVFALYIEPTLGKIALCDLTPMKVQRLYTKLRKTLAPRTVRYVHSILHGALDHAVALKLIRSNPSKGLKLPKKDSPEIRYLRGEEIPAFLKAARENMRGSLFEFLIASGVRPGEGLGLKWDDIDFEAGTVEIQRSVSGAKPWTYSKPKTKKGRRTIGLPKPTLETLQAHKEAQEKEVEVRLEEGDEWEENGLVFCDSKGQPLDRRNLASKHLKKLFKRVAVEMKLKGKDQERVTSCSLYSLRHSHATRLIEAGVDLRTVSERLGHKDPTTTLEKYVHSTPIMKKKAVEEISKAMYS